MRLTITADDFGRSHEINEAVLRAYRGGILTSASLMVAGEAAAEAIEIAREHPGLEVGLHVVVVDGPPVLAADQITRLVDDRGRFANTPVRVGWRYAICQAARRQLADEIAAQFERFAGTGLPLSHVDGHQHMHMHPAVFHQVARLGRQYGARRIRVVRDDLRLALQHNPRGAVAKVVANGIFALLAKRCRRVARQYGLLTPDRTYGFYQSGAMDEAYVLSAIRHLREQNVEMYFHPTTGPRLDELGPNPTDFATLVSRRVRSEMEARRLLMSPDGEGSEPLLKRSGPAVSIS